MGVPNAAGYIDWDVSEVGEYAEPGEEETG